MVPRSFEALLISSGVCGAFACDMKPFASFSSNFREVISISLAFEGAP